uniref:UTP--glucose-1-phosphate uridylyltransferase n=1 Tax=Leersia perrieri TaxID=77586 RepID=A0A0D9XGE8_9ORYZ
MEPERQPPPPPPPPPQPALMDTELPRPQKLDRLRQSVPLIKGISDIDSEGFLRMAARYLSNEHGGRIYAKPEKEVMVQYDTICEVAKDRVKTSEAGRVASAPELPHEIQGEDLEIKKMLDRLVVLKINAESGKRMGSRSPRTLIKFPDGSIPLDHFVKEIESLNIAYKCDIPLLVMNSFMTMDDTLKVITRYKDSNVKLFLFSQSKYPAIDDNFYPVAFNGKYPDDCWYPPGDGDVYASLYNNRRLHNGNKFVFIASGDNLGATIDLSIQPYVGGLRIIKLETDAEDAQKTKDEVRSVWYENMFWFGTVICYGFVVRRRRHLRHMPAALPVDARRWADEGDAEILIQSGMETA